MTSLNSNINNIKTFTAMKKALLLSAIASVACTAAFAQGPNLVVNGSFDDPNFQQSVPEGYTWEPWNSQYALTDLPGWTINDNGPWNGGCTVLQERPGDDDPRPEEDEIYLNMWGYNDNGWANIEISQIVKGLTPGTQYTFRFQYNYNFPTGEYTSTGWAPDPNYGASICEVDGNMAGRTIVDYNCPNSPEWSSNDMWQQFEQTFTATGTEVYLTFYISNWYTDGNKKDGLYMDLDNVEIFDPNGDSGIEDITFDSNAPVEYYNIQGLRVNEIGDNHGVYIVKQGTKVVKRVM